MCIISEFKKGIEMKKFLLVVGIFVAVFSLSGCEKQEYQHPAHRSGAVK